MNKFKSALKKVKNHVLTHKFAYAMSVVAAAAIYGNVRSAGVFNEFLIEKGIDPLEFSCPEWYEELKQSEGA